MSRRFCLYAAGTLFAAAVALAFADLWWAGVMFLSGCTYFAGRFDHQRQLAEVTAERDSAVARERRLDDELNDLHRARCGQVHNGAGHLSPAALNDRNSNSTADRGVPAQVRADFLP